MSTNNTYLVVFLGSKTGMTEWNELTEEKRQAKKQEGIAAWKSWNEKHRAAIVGLGGPLGKTKKITEHDITDTSNDMGAFMARIRMKPPPSIREASALHDLSGRIRGGNAPFCRYRTFNPRPRSL